MPQLATVILKDRASTPANITLVPSDIKDGVGVLQTSTGVPLAETVVSIARRITPANKYKVTLKIKRPIVQDQNINGVINPVVVRVAYADVTLSFDSTSTLQERKDISGMIYSAFAPDQAILSGVLAEAQGVY